MYFKKRDTSIPFQINEWLSDGNNYCPNQGSDNRQTINRK